MRITAGKKAENVQRIRELLEEGKSIPEIGEELGLMASTVRRYMVDYALQVNHRAPNASAWTQDFCMRWLESINDYRRRMGLELYNLPRCFGGEGNE